VTFSVLLLVAAVNLMMIVMMEMEYDNIKVLKRVGKLGCFLTAFEQ